MKKTLFILAIGLFVALSSFGQVKIDTLYYDRNWKGVESKAFATYFRIIANSDNSSFKKQFRSFYITGELQSEGNYISIDKYDDSLSIFDGECITYYKSGKIEQKGYKNKGKLEGEYVKYNEDGLILYHSYFKNNKLDGIYTEFSEENNICVQIEYTNGKPVHDYYMVSNSDGLCSKIRLSDNQPIYESPLVEEMKLEYKDGKAWAYYNKNGIMIGMNNNEVRDYGKFYQITIIIANNSLNSIDFDPNSTTAILMDKKGYVQKLKVHSVEEYMKKVRRNQNWAMALNGVTEGLAAASAGYSTSTTNSSYSGYSSSRGTASAYSNGVSAYGHYYDNSSYYGNSSSTTTSYNAAAAYQAQVIASNRIAAYDNALLSERASKNEGYLKRTTIYPGETITGYINIERKKGINLTIDININGAIYEFPWSIGKLDQEVRQFYDIF